MRGQLFDASQAHSGSMGQRAAEIWTSQTDSQSGRVKPDRLPSRSEVPGRLEDRGGPNQFAQRAGLMDAIALRLIDAELAQAVDQRAILDPLGHRGLAERSRDFARCQNHRVRSCIRANASRR